MSHIRTIDQPMTAEEVISRFEEAGRTLMALPAKGCRPAGYGNGWPAVVHAMEEAYGYGEAEIRPPVPSAQAITRMDEAYGWVNLLPDQRRSYRRIVLLRSLVHPVRDRHVFGWRKIGRMLGWDYRAVQNWHAKGIDLIVDALRARTLHLCSK